ncbi:MAG: hypothetical protein QOC94_4099, partial [Actinoplanes sp.]|nr:hypothetical protein [Actinoplanes sp.]
MSSLGGQAGRPDREPRSLGYSRMSLDAIDWSALRHAYGPATDVPALLRDLTRRKRCHDAAGELDSALYHQGTAVPAAATAALPFLVQAASNRRVRCRPAILELIAALAEESRIHAGSTFVDPGWRPAFRRSLPELLTLLADDDPAIRAEAGTAVASTCDDQAQTADALRNRWAVELDHPVRVWLILCIGRLHRRPETGVVPAADLAWLRARLRDPHPEARLAAAMAADGLPGRPLGAPDVALVADGLRHVEEATWSLTSNYQGLDSVVQWCARQFDPQLWAWAVPALIGEPAAPRRLAAVELAAEVLWRGREHTDLLIPMIAGRLTDLQPRVRESAAHLLAAVGQPARPYADQLAALLTDHTRRHEHRGRISEVAVWALVRLGDPRCLPPLLDRLTRRRTPFGKGVTGHNDLPTLDEVLARLPGHGDVLLPALLDWLDRRADEGRTDGLYSTLESYTQCLAAWGPAAAPVVPKLIPLLDQPYSRPEIQVLGRIGPAAAEAAPALRSIVANPAREPLIRLAAAASCALIGMPDLDLDPSVIASALDDPTTADDAARYLGDIGPATRRHIPALRTLIRSDRHPPFPVAEAGYALWKLTGDPDEVVPFLLPLISLDHPWGFGGWVAAAAE